MLLAAGGVVGAAVLALATGQLDGDGSSGTAFESPIPPAEFLYLDGGRVLNYLAQLEGGEVGPVHRITKEINSVSGDASTAGFKIGASSQHENEADSTLTRTESSALGLLMADLEEDRQSSTKLHYVRLNGPASVERLKEGWLVRFVTRDLISPGYIRPYVVVRQSATLAALFPQAAGDPAGAALAETQRRKAKSFARQVGRNPRITFAISPPPASPARAAMKVLLPMRYLGLTNERSLLEKSRDRYTGGKLVVIGKVIRVFRSNDPCHTRSCVQDREPQYTDFATQEIWRNPIEQASNWLIDHVSHTCRVEAGMGKPGGAAEEVAVKGRSCFLDKLERQTRLYAPGAVILPLAVYK